MKNSGNQAGFDASPAGNVISECMSEKIPYGLSSDLSFFTVINEKSFIKEGWFMDNSQEGPLKPLTFAKMSVRIIKKNLRKSFVFFRIAACSNLSIMGKLSAP